MKKYNICVKITIEEEPILSHLKIEAKSVIEAHYKGIALIKRAIEEVANSEED